jgi:hypothetical protein
VVLVAWVAAAALVRGIGDIALGFHMQHGRCAVAGVEKFADQTDDEFVLRK